MNLEYAFIDYFCRLEILCFRKYKEESIESSFDKYLEYESNSINSSVLNSLYPINNVLNPIDKQLIMLYFIFSDV